MDDSDNIVSFTEAHDKRHGPDPEHVYRDGMGVKWFEFTCSFSVDGKEFGFHLWALDRADCERRLDALKQTAEVDGQLYAIVPA